MKLKSSLSDKILDCLIYFFLIVSAITMFYPFWNAVVISFNDGLNTSMGGITVWPKKFTLENYSFVLQDKRLLQAFGVSVARTVIGTLMSIFFTSLLAYGLSKKELRFYKFYMKFFVITMYVSGGLIPSYIVIRSLGLINKFWVYVIPGTISVWNMIIFRSFFCNLPVSLEESAMIDGASYFTIFFKIVIPTSTAVFATLTLFSAVHQWNAWFDASIYVSKPQLMPLQTLLRQIINSNAMSQLMQELDPKSAESLLDSQITTKAITMTTMMVATLPIICVYPFLQKYFVKGVMIGSIKE